ncbi:MAG: hypothetical protein LBI44_02025 [Oscillospiraceae bacterium]|jgi:MinD-like ATPase involved in chromosome partitioning or flagellar assembly|nr:hypothetical protein [Oscillospiraceae bacterium]
MSDVTVFAGHCGSGKTVVAVNYAIWLQKRHGGAVLADIDTVNPYFRASDFARALGDAGVRFVVSELAGSNAEAPGFPPAAAAVFDGGPAVVDAGGDDRGALALGRLAGSMPSPPDMLMVVNMYRPLTENARQVAEYAREIEAAAKLRFTGICNNSHLGADTREADVAASLPYAAAVSRALGLPVRMTAADSRFAAALAGKCEGFFGLRILSAAR